MAKPDTSAIDASNYISLSTFKRDGSEVATPVWFAGTNGTYFVFSAGDAGKVKRLRNSDRSTIAPCTVSGKILGDAVITSSTLLNSDNEIKAAHRALVDKYGWQMRLLDFGSTLGGKIKKRAFIKIVAT